MAECILLKSGGGGSSDDCTAAKSNVLTGMTAITKDSDDEPAAGTMPNQGAKTSALNCGGSYTIPAGYHNGAGKVTANSLASQTGGVTADDAHVVNGYTYWRDGVKRTGSMTVSSVVSFSVAAYSVSQVLATWKNPAKGPYSGFAICAKTGGYPGNINDGRVYTGTGNNAALNAQNSAVISGLAAGQTYYFRIWTYCGCSSGDLYSGYQQTACTLAAHGRAYFTSGGTWTVPAGVRSINIHCTGGGGGSGHTTGGCGGNTSYLNNIVVTPGQQVQFTVGSGGTSGNYGGDSSASTNGSVLVSAGGGRISNASGSGSGRSGSGQKDSKRNVPGAGGADGGNGYGSVTIGTFDRHTGYENPNGGTGGQGRTTREFGTGTLYSGGGAGGYNGNGYDSPGGEGGGGNTHAAGSAGTGGGAGGAGWDSLTYGTNGGSGNVVITW